MQEEGDFYVKKNLNNPNNRNNRRYELRIQSLEMNEGGMRGGGNARLEEARTGHLL